MIYPENLKKENKTNLAVDPNKKNPKSEKLIEEYQRVLGYLDNSYIKKLCGEIALKVVKYGCYYGYVIQGKESIQVQELPADYCRTRYSVSGLPVIEFNMAFFDDKFKDPVYRMKILKLFPDEFAKGYELYKKQKLNNENDGFYEGYERFKFNYGWYVLDPGSAVKFNINGSDIPIFINSLPAILDLDAAQELDRKK